MATEEPEPLGPSLYDTFLATGTLGDVMESEEDAQSTSLSLQSGESKNAIYRKRAQQAELERKNLASKENRAVTWLRVLAVVVLIVTALVVCLGIFFYAKNDEKQDFEFVFESSAERVIQSFHESVARLLAGADAMSVAVTSYALDTEATWPMVTVPNFDLRGANVRIMTKSLACVFIPLIKEEDRSVWEEYVTQKITQEKTQMKAFMSDTMHIARQDESFGLETIPFQMPGAGGSGPMAGSSSSSMMDTPMAMPEGEQPMMAMAEGNGDTMMGRQGSGDNMMTMPEGNGDNMMAMPEGNGDTMMAMPEGNGDTMMPMPEGESHMAMPANPLAGRNFSSSIDTMMGMGPQPLGKGPYLAFYQTSPVLPAPALPNIDVMSIPPLAPNARQVLASNKAVLGRTHEPMTMFNMFLAQGQYRHDKNAFLGDAATPFLYPVFDNFGPVKELVGIVLTNIYWRLHFENILPPNARGVVAVLYDGTADESFTYQIDGASVMYKGPGDLHDRAYDSYEVTADLTEYLTSHAGPATQGYTSVPFADTAVKYTLHIYPSKEMEDMYVSNEPAIFAIVVACVFVFTSLVFLAYNTMVERRQKVVFDRAVKSAAVLSDLFPEQVKEELINGSGMEKVKENASDTWKTNRDTAVARPRMARKYPKVTILFADIAGFTGWSSNRDPEDVFVLLETFYAAFDLLAIKRDVFKVETIGDCYLAATGLPNPQSDHAFRMVKFARDCLQKVPVLTAKLAETLGDGTRNLGLRVGLHSGSVTAGVLRGDKSRFQLFGDSVNTAAGMESNGIKDKVHISAETYNELVAKGKGHVAVKRDLEIDALGKGVMQTYFLAHNFINPGSATAVMSTASTNKVCNISTASSTCKTASNMDTASDGHSSMSFLDYQTADSSSYSTPLGLTPPSSAMNPLGLAPPESAIPSQGGGGGDDDSLGSSVGTSPRPHWQTMVAAVDQDDGVDGVDC